MSRTKIMLMHIFIGGISRKIEKYKIWGDDGAQVCNGQANQGVYLSSHDFEVANV